MFLLMKVQSNAQRTRYDDFPQVTYLECNSGVKKIQTSSDHTSANIAPKALKFGLELQHDVFSNGFFFLLLKRRRKKL